MKTKQFIPSSLTLTSWVLALGAMVALAASEAREEFHQTYPLSQESRISLDNVNGSVRVVTWDREEIKVDAIKRAKEKEDLDEVSIDVNAQPDSIRIKTRYPNTRNSRNSASVDYTLTVPKQSRLDKISTVNGGVEIINVIGNISAKSVNGAVTGTGLSGDVDLSSVNGAVKAVMAEVKKEVSLKTVNGSVSVALPSSANADITANTLNGNIKSDFPLQINQRSGSGKDARGHIGEGGARIKLASVNGGVRIDQQ